MSAKSPGDRPGVLIRDMLLTAKPSAFHIEPVRELPHVWAALMELRMGGVMPYDGLRGARDEEKKLRHRRSPLWPAFYLGHDVITALRLTEQKSER